MKRASIALVLSIPMILAAACGEVNDDVFAPPADDQRETLWNDDERDADEIVIDGPELDGRDAVDGAVLDGQFGPLVSMDGQNAQVIEMGFGVIVDAIATDGAWAMMMIDLFDTEIASLRPGTHLVMRMGEAPYEVVGELDGQEVRGWSQACSSPGITDVMGPEEDGWWDVGPDEVVIDVSETEDGELQIDMVVEKDGDQMRGAFTL